MQANLPSGIKKEVLLATTSEGMRLRNQTWKADIEEYRKAYPDALIIVHAGFGHIDYTIPHSLGRAFQNDKTFVISFFPGYTKSNYPEETKRTFDNVTWLENYTPGPGNYMPISMFDYLTGGQFPQRILQFDKEDAPITGFDIQFKVPESQPQPSDNDTNSILELLLEIFSH
jgi:hypothetical protein